jgi:hypothetical protein
MAKKSTDERLEELEKWRTQCSIIAAGVGGIWMTITTIGSIVYSYWEDIKHFFASLKQ